MDVLDLAAFRAAPLCRTPFEHLVLPRFIRPEAFHAIIDDYPEIRKPGSFPLSELEYGPAFASLMEQLQGPEVRGAFSEKFGTDLDGRTVMITVRGHCAEHDGRIHTDSASKLITVLIYMNPAWEKDGGRLRLLRSAGDMEDYFAEVPPDEGTLVTFRRSTNSFHGHKSFAGPRRVIQLNWMTRDQLARYHTLRHRLSALFKK